MQFLLQKEIMRIFLCTAWQQEQKLKRNGGLNILWGATGVFTTPCFFNNMNLKLRIKKVSVKKKKRFSKQKEYSDNKWNASDLATNGKFI